MPDTTISGTQVGILTSSRTYPVPNIVLDNVASSGVGAFLQNDAGKIILGSAPAGVWATGMRYDGGKGSDQTGPVVDIPTKDPSLTSSGGKLFVRSRPQYEGLGSGSFLVATDAGIANDGTGDQSTKINAFLITAASSGMIAYFPAGIYLIQDTIIIPLGSRIQGSSWSQVRYSNSYFPKYRPSSYFTTTSYSSTLPPLFQTPHLPSANSRFIFPGLRFTV